MKKSIGCDCKFERLQIRVRMVPSVSILSLVRFVQRIKCLCKGRKIVRRKMILQCRKCGSYSVECPYCHQSTIMANLPEVATCPHCGKVYQAKLFEF